MNFQYESNCIYLEDETGKRIAEVTFPAVTEEIVEIDHTFVDASLRGQGVAGRLMEAVAEYLKSNHKKVRPTCSYAAKWFGEHAEYEALLA